MSYSIFPRANRLLNTPRGTSRGRKIDIVNSATEEVFRVLVRERKAMSFLAGADDDADTGEKKARQRRAGPARRRRSDRRRGRTAARRLDRLQTRLNSERLQARLLAMYYDSQTYVQEQGISILYLAAAVSQMVRDTLVRQARYTPLLLLPVDLDRASAKSRFYLGFGTRTSRPTCRCRRSSRRSSESSPARGSRQ